MGLREQIKTANSEAEISTLLSKGGNFEFASDRTKLSWKSTAKVRLDQLTGTDATQSPEKTVESKKVKAKVVKKKTV
tara:strand:+ start:943 stop:1173 length:231 start_codon:yes stop_codon:yes gene_type:complete